MSGTHADNADGDEKEKKKKKFVTVEITPIIIILAWGKGECNNNNNNTGDCWRARDKNDPDNLYAKLWVLTRTHSHTLEGKNNNNHHHESRKRKKPSIPRTIDDRCN